MHQKDLTNNLTKGDPEAFRFLFSEYYIPLCIYASRFTRDKSSAEEIVHETFVKLWEHREHIGAAEDINKLRDRAFKNARTSTGNPNLGMVSASDITLDFILDERARELIGEENRRMTLMRTGKLKSRIALNGDTKPADKIITGFEDKNNLLPIPLSEIRLNKDAVIEQNPGY